MPIIERKSFCRICHVGCGMVLSVDDETKRIVDIRPDREDTSTLGYACSKGLQVVDQHYGAARILRPLKRMPGGRFEEIALEQALDEIASQMRAIIDRDGGEAIAGYKGSGAYQNALATMALPEFLAACGSQKIFSGFTIDQSAKVVTMGRVGVWPAGLYPFQTIDTSLVIGSNPLVSMSALDGRHPRKRIMEAKARGLTLIVIDPRRTETAQLADIFLQPYPGEDTGILAGLLRLIFAEGWHDKDFCAQHVSDLELLRAGVQPFTEDYVAGRAGLRPGQLRQVAEAFALRGKRGTAVTGTGPDMARHSNLAEHLVACLNIVCGRFVREGEQVLNPGFLSPRYPRHAHVIPADRPWEKSYKSRIGSYGMVFGEMMTGILADEILRPGPGQVRCLINDGGNPASSIPDQRKIVDAFRSLELLVSIEPYMTQTAKLSHYIIPPKLQYERQDFPLWIFETMVFPTPFTRFTDAIVPPPAGSEVSDDWYVLWALAQRLGRQLIYQGVPLDMSRPPESEELARIISRHAPLSFEEIKNHPMGVAYDKDPQFALPPDPNVAGKFTLMPDDVQAELAEIAREEIGAALCRGGKSYRFRVSTRRVRHRFNSLGHTFKSLVNLLPTNLAYLNPADMDDLEILDEEIIEIASESGAIEVQAKADPTVRHGVISLTHGFGDLPDSDREDPSAAARPGVSINLLISTDHNLETINAMPWMSSIPVNVRKLNSLPSRSA
jgi:anaerobic selenocysteine-containing dehydrogenase